VTEALARGPFERNPGPLTIQGRPHAHARATESSKYPHGWGWLTGAIGLLGGISGFIQPFGDKLSAHRRQVTDIADELRQRSEQVAAQAKAELQNANARLPAETRRMFDLLRELSEGVSKGR
jgi:hypothetical protein